MYANGLAVCMLTKGVRQGLEAALIYYAVYGLGIGLWYLTDKIVKD